MPSVNSKVSTTGTSLVTVIAEQKAPLFLKVTNVAYFQRVALKMRAFATLHSLDINRVQVRWGNSTSSQGKRPKFQIESVDHPEQLVSKFHFSGLPNMKGCANYNDDNLRGPSDYKWVITRIASLGGAIH